MKKFKVSLILSTLYIIYAWVMIMSSTLDVNSSAEAVGTGLAFMIILPHLIVATIGLIFHILGARGEKRGFIITAGVLYSVAIALCLFWAFLLIPGMITTWVSLKKIEKK